MGSPSNSNTEDPKFMDSSPHDVLVTIESCRQTDTQNDKFLASHSPAQQRRPIQQKNKLKSVQRLFTEFTHDDWKIHMESRMRQLHHALHTDIERYR